MANEKQLPFDFDVVGFEKADDGTYTGMITADGFTLQFKDSNGKPIPLNKEAIEQFLQNRKEDEQCG